ncbi:MAG: DUF952 domain-containing protein [Devosiaceae bacterium]|nr:DUF952 domain-containing protein [Devosiaceae bacterium MH13]
MAAPIFKIEAADIWAQAREAGQYAGAPVDLADGFIHFSAADQVQGTLEKHFAGRPNLLIIAVDPDALGEPLRWEPSRGGALFPHLYGPLPMHAVIGEAPVSEDGSLPERPEWGLPA